MQKKNGMKIPVAILLSLAAGLAVTILLASVIAVLIAAQKVSEQAVPFGAMCVTILGSVTAALVMAGKIQQKRILMCLAGGGIYLMGLMILAATLFEGISDGVVVSAALALAGAVIAFLLTMNPRKKQKYGRYKPKR